ncbi:MAG: pilus assembly protein [Hyphomicrobiales bacterium]|nr:pilus assembly protein [Hyphomicrobiales bacterium]
MTFFEFIRNAFPGLRKNFLKDDSGVTAVEFAFVSVPFFALLFAIIETSLVYFNQQALDASTFSAARAVMTSNTTTQTAFYCSICPRPSDSCASSPTTILPSTFNCQRLIVDVQNYANFNGTPGTSSTPPATPTFSPGGTGTVNVVRVYYPMPVYLSFLIGNMSPRTKDSSGNWTHNLFSISVFVME